MKSRSGQQKSPALLIIAAVLLSACAVGRAVPPAGGPAARLGMDPRLGARLDSLISAALADGAAPGAAVVVGRHGQIVHMAAYGRIDTAAAAPAVTDSTMFDLASLTKV